MEIRVFRDCFGEDFTLGDLSIDGKHFCYTCEDTDRRLEEDSSRKVYGKTAIPRGRYRVVLSMSHRFGKILPEILGVYGFTGIRIHSGFSPADTDGCVIGGMARDTKNGTVHRSRESVDLIQNKIKQAIDAGDKVYIEVM